MNGGGSWNWDSLWQGGNKMCDVTHFSKEKNNLKSADQNLKL